MALKWIRFISLADWKKVADASSALDGSYRFDLLPPGTYTIQAKAMYPAETAIPNTTDPGHPITREVTVQLLEDDVLDANIDLPVQASGK